MYIADKYWNNYIGYTDDSLTLVEYLAAKNQEEIALGEIFSDIGLDKLNGDFRQTGEPLTVVMANTESDYEEPEISFYYAIDLIADLAALLLECKMNESVNLCELAGYDLETDVPDVRNKSTTDEHELIHKVLTDFVTEPLA